jgi:hypothetical protein
MKLHKFQPCEVKGVRNLSHDRIHFTVPRFIFPLPAPNNRLSRRQSHFPRPLKEAASRIGAQYPASKTRSALLLIISVLVASASILS